MKHTPLKIALKIIYGLTILFLVSACGENSSPEGRMINKMEALQKEMIDSLKQQNSAVLDSIRNIRTELNELKQQIK